MRRYIRTFVGLALCLQIGGCLVTGSYGNSSFAQSGFAGGSGVLPAIPPVGGSPLIQTVPTGGFIGGSGFAVGGTFGGSVFGGGFSAIGAQQGSIVLTSP